MRAARGIAIALAIGALLSVVLYRSGPDGTKRVEGTSRVVLFAPNLTETAFELGVGDRVVAVTDYCVWPPAATALPTVGGMIDPNLERLAALSPQLLVLQGENADLRSFAATHQLTVASVKMDDDVASILAGFQTLDEILNGPASTRGEELRRRVEAELATAKVTATSPSPSVLLVLGREPDRLEGLYTVGGGSFLSELVEYGGGRNLFASSRPGYFLLSLETLLATPPDVVLEIRAGEVVDDRARARIRAAWNRPGLEACRVEVLTFDGIMIPGPRIGETARVFAGAIAGTDS